MNIFKNIKPVLAAVLLLHNICSIYTQEVFDFQKEVTEKFLKYCSVVPWEEVYIHTDRNEYVAGEELWFSAYLINRQDQKPAAAGKILYVEILNQANRPVVQKRVMIDSGFGPGEIVLPDTLSSGKYTLRAYTSRMKNFMPANCFMRSLNIYNALNPGGPITAFSSPGTPAADSTVSVSIPQITGTGFSVRVNNRQPGILEFNIASGEEFRRSNRNLCYLFIHTRGVVNFTGPVNLTEQNSRFTVKQDILLPGINHIAFFSSRGELLDEQFIYKPGAKSLSLNIFSPDSCKRRDKIQVEINLPGLKNMSDGISNMSISVQPVTGLNDRDDIAGWLVFGSEFGMIPDEIRYIHPDNIPPDVLEEFLRRINSHWINWQAILSGNYPAIKYADEKEYHYLHGLLVNRSTMSPVPGEYLFLSLPGKNAKFQYAVTGNDGKFVFCLPADEDLRDIIIQPGNPGKNISIELYSPFSDLYALPSSVQVQSAEKTPPHILKWSTNYQVNRIYGITFSEAPVKRFKSTEQQWRFYGKPDIEIKMDEYIKLPVMEEVFFELLPGIILKKREAQYEISFIDPPEFRTYGKPPVLMVDGVIVKDATIIGNMNPELVERIDVVKDRYMAGDYLFYGVVNIITRTGDFRHVPLPDNAAKLRYRAADPVASFRSPDYSETENLRSTLPDFRNTLYWNGSLKPDKDGKIMIEIWASDYAATYEINVQGITSEGKPVLGKRLIKVY